MNIEYVPLLQVQRDLQGLPRDYNRFRKYLGTMLSQDGQGLELPPLGIVNPMARDHVTRMLDDLLRFDADGIAAKAAAEAAVALAELPGDFKVTLVVVDDLMGGWTNRFDHEFKLRFPTAAGSSDGSRLPRWTKHFWITAVLWSSELPSEKSVREAVLTALYRSGYIQQHGCARTLRDMLAQEGHIMAKAGCTAPVLEDDDIAYTREVLIPFLDDGNMRTAIECLFGDEAGRTLGFTPRGLSPWAGLALALHDARFKSG